MKKYSFIFSELTILATFNFARFTSLLIYSKNYNKWKPNKLFKARPRNERYNKWKNAYLHLSELQKDYYNIPSGFIKVTSQAGKKTSKRDKKKEIKKNQLDALPEQVKNLYSDLSSSNFESLKSGLSIPNIKSEFPILYEPTISSSFSSHKIICW